MARDCNRTQRTAKSKRPRVAHEHGGRRRIEPQKGKPCPHYCRAEDRKFTRTLDIGNAEVFGIVDAAHKIGNDSECSRSDDYRHDREAIQPVSQVHGIAEADDQSGGKDEIERPKRDRNAAEERYIEIGADLADDDVARDPSDYKLQQQAHLARNAAVARLGNLVVIVEKTDQAEANCHRQTRPNQRVGYVHPQQQGEAERDKDHQPAHRRRADFRQMALRAVSPDRLPLALPYAKQVDKARPDQQAEEQRCDQRRARTKRLVTDKVQYTFETQPFGDQVEHLLFLGLGLGERPANPGKV